MQKKATETGRGPNVVLGTAVKEAMAGRNYRAVAEEIGLHYTTLYDLAKGFRKSRPTIVKFAAGIGESEEKWLYLAGYGQPPPEVRLAEAVEEIPAPPSYEPDTDDLRALLSGGGTGSDRLREQVLKAYRVLRDRERGIAE